MKEADVQPIEAPALRLLAWNIYRNYRPERIQQTLKRLIAQHRPDVLALQEVPVYATHAFADLPLFEPFFRQYAPAHHIYQPSRRLNFETTGQLTLARPTISAWDAVELPVLPSRARPSERDAVRRCALYTRFHLNGGRTLGVYNVHLENQAWAGGRQRQVEHLLSTVTEKGDDVEVFAGDFNTFLAGLEGSLRRLRAAGFVCLFPSLRYGLLPRLDHVFVRGAAGAEGVQLRGRGSDHAPILARIDL